MRKNFRRTGSHCKVLMFINSVREAFEASVTCSLPSVKRYNGCLDNLAMRRDKAYINDPRLDSTKQEIVFLVSFAYSLVMVD